ncbi:MAG TPA: 2-oxoacid:ferredoxin oxidoreductase subunit beta, partial [Anaerolineae bacterium]|nr:2-oxoacid:ferredoxin oxidoreductase subunit beta [Anaerolineae bacterium]
VVEAVSYCHTTFGRLNRLGGAVEMMRRLKDDAIPVERAKGMPPEQLEGKIVRGVFVDRDTPEFTERYQKVIAMAQAQAKGGA